MINIQSDKSDFQKLYYDALQKQVSLLEEKVKFQEERNQQKCAEYEQKILDIAQQKDEYNRKLEEKDIIIQTLYDLVEEQSKKLIEQEEQIKNLNKNEISESRIIHNNESLDQESGQAVIQLFAQKKSLKVNILQDDQEKSNQRFGTIEVCLVIDTTESMMQNKQFIISTIRDVNHKIKQQSSLNIKWAVVTYKDYQENQQYRPYPQISFNEDVNTILDFINEQQFCGGGDFAEDLKNGLQQALNLEWQSKKKVVMIITDAPCHGFKYNQDVNDKFPNDVIEEQLDQIIQQKIYLVCVGFKNQYDLTRVMFKEFKKYFQSKNYKKIDRHTIHEKATAKKEEFVDFTVYKILKDISLSLNQMRQSTYFQQIQDHKVQKFEFQLFNCECDPTKLQEYIDNDNLKLGYNENFYKYEQKGEIRCCEREAQPFYQDSVKKIFKMKYSRNNGDIDLYALTSLVDGPFKSKYTAASFIKTYLIAKVLYKQFQLQLNNSFSNICFSNYILLKEKNMNQNDQQELYWIAQKFYEKDQIYQFNDGEGNLTSLEDSDYNEFLQSFSYFTYFESNCKLLVCDLKVYKNILLHPKINTHSGQYGQYGQQDNGIDSIHNFLFQFRNFQKQYKYLDYLSITYKMT